MYAATLSSPNNQCGTYTVTGTTPLGGDDTTSLDITVQDTANATAMLPSCDVQSQVDSSSLRSISALPEQATGSAGGVSKWAPQIRPFSLQPVYLVQVRATQNLTVPQWAVPVCQALQHCLLQILSQVIFCLVDTLLQLAACVPCAGKSSHKGLTVLQLALSVWQALQHCLLQKPSRVILCLVNALL